MCDVLVALGAATADGITRFAKNSDRPEDERQVLEHHPARREDATRTTYLTIPGAAGPTLATVLSRPAWMWGAEHGVNEAGVAAGNATVFTTLDPRRAPAALTGMDLVRLALERATTAAEAVELIGRLIDEHGQGGSGHEGAERPYWSSFLVADPGAAFVVETSGRGWRCSASKAGMVVRFEIARVRSTVSTATARPDVSTTNAAPGSATRNDDQ
jgi:secernin